MGLKSFVTKVVSNSALQTATGIVDIVERWAPSAEKKHEFEKEIDQLVEASVASARAMPLGNTATWFDSLINGLNRSIQ